MIGIKLNGAPVVPALSYDHVHVSTLHVEQAVFTNDSLSPVFRVVMEYRLYAILDGVRHYHPTIFEVAYDDFLTTALQKAGEGNTAYLAAIQSLRGAVAAIVACETGNDTEAV